MAGIVARLLIHIGAKSDTSGLNKTDKALRGTSNTLNRVSRSARNASKNFGFLNKATRLLGIGAGLFAVKNAITGYVQFEQQLGAIHSRFFALTKDSKKANEEFEFARKIAKDTATDINSVIDSYSIFYSSAKRSLGTDNAREVYKNWTEVSRVLHLSGAQYERVMYALREMSSKGQLYAQDLMIQMGTHVPDVRNIAEEAIKRTMESLGVKNVTTIKDFQEYTKKNKGSEAMARFLVEFSRESKKRYASDEALKKALEQPDALIQQIRQFGWDFMYEFSKAGGGYMIVKILNGIVNTVKNIDFVALTKSIGIIAKFIGKIFDFLPTIVSILGKILYFVGLTYLFKGFNSIFKGFKYIKAFFSRGKGFEKLLTEGLIVSLMKNPTSKLAKHLEEILGAKVTGEAVKGTANIATKGVTDLATKGAITSVANATSKLASKSVNGAEVTKAIGATEKAIVEGTAKTAETASKVGKIGGVVERGFALAIWRMLAKKGLWYGLKTVLTTLLIPTGPLGWLFTALMFLPELIGICKWIYNKIPGTKGYAEDRLKGLSQMSGLSEQQATSILHAVKDLGVKDQSDLVRKLNWYKGGDKLTEFTYVDQGKIYLNFNGSEQTIDDVINQGEKLKSEGFGKKVWNKYFNKPNPTANYMTSDI